VFPLEFGIAGEYTQLGQMIPFFLFLLLLVLSPYTAQSQSDPFLSQAACLGTWATGNSYRNFILSYATVGGVDVRVGSYGAVVTKGSTLAISASFYYTYDGYCPGCMIQFYIGLVNQGTNVACSNA
jgi:hypothetical protein